MMDGVARRSLALSACFSLSPFFTAPVPPSCGHQHAPTRACHTLARRPQEPTGRTPSNLVRSVGPCPTAG